MLKEKFKEVGRLNNEIYKEDLGNIRESILGISGSFFTKKMFDGVYQYQDHSIGMSRRILEQKVIQFKGIMNKQNIQTLIVFENQLSVRLNQRNSILKRTLTDHSVQFVNTPYSEHAQLIYYYKNNLISGIVSDLDIIKYFSETNNYVIVDLDLDLEQFEWIHLSKFLASMNLTHHYARQLLLQEISLKKAQNNVIQQFDNIQKQKNFDRDSSVNHPSYKDQIFRIEYVPIINISCNLQFYKQTIETQAMEERMKKHFGLILPPIFYQFFAFDLISSDIFNIFGFSRFKYIPNIYDSKELKTLLSQTRQHYSKVIALIKQHMPETTYKSDTFNFISENEEYIKETTPSANLLLNYEFISTDLILEPSFSYTIQQGQSQQNGSNSSFNFFSTAGPGFSSNNLQQTKLNNSLLGGGGGNQLQGNSNVQIMHQQSSLDVNSLNSQFGEEQERENQQKYSYDLLVILQKFVDILRKNSKNPSRKGSEAQSGGNTQESSKGSRSRHQIGDYESKGLDYQRLNSLLSSQVLGQEVQEQSKLYSTTKFLQGNQLQNLKRTLTPLQIFSLAALNFFHLQELINLTRQQITQLAKYLCKCNPDFSEQLLIFSNIIQNEALCGIFFSNLFFDPEEIQLALQLSMQSQSYASNNPNLNSSKSSINMSDLPKNSNESKIQPLEEPETNPQIPPTQNTQQLIQEQQQFKQPPIPVSTTLNSQKGDSLNQKDPIQRKLIDEKLSLEERMHILVISRIFSLSELSFREWKQEEWYDFELTQYIKIIQSVQSILRNQIDCLLLCAYSSIGNNSNMLSVLETKRFMPFRKNYNCGMGILLILLLQRKVKLEDLLRNDDNFPFICQEMQQAFLLWESILNFIKLQQTDKYVDPSIIKIYEILSQANDFLHKRIERSLIFTDA